MDATLLLTKNYLPFFALSLARELFRSGHRWALVTVFLHQQLLNELCNNVNNTELQTFILSWYVYGVCNAIYLARHL